MSKFKIGDHVIVREDSSYEDQRKFTGKITNIDSYSKLPVTIKYDSCTSPYESGEYNNYKFDDLEHSIIHNSPLFKALS
jgi:hypothetical protein